VKSPSPFRLSLSQKSKLKRDQQRHISQANRNDFQTAQTSVAEMDQRLQARNSTIRDQRQKIADQNENIQQSIRRVPELNS
jgi:predicted  nucleic acid-binding Zn-ribbon protein